MEQEEQRKQDLKELQELEEQFKLVRFRSFARFTGKEHPIGHNIAKL